MILNKFMQVTELLSRIYKLLKNNTLYIFQEMFGKTVVLLFSKIPRKKSSLEIL